MSSRTHNLQAGLLMTALVGAAFLIHPHEQAAYLAGESSSPVAEGRAAAGSPASAVIQSGAQNAAPAGPAAESLP